jgi:methionyl-tRNA formyltransferase
VDKLKVVFMGTPEFAVPSLEKLVEEGYEIPLVITQPDKPAGRGKKLKPPPVKLLAVEKGIPVVQPESLKGNEELKKRLEELELDLIVVVAYGKILPPWILEIPKFGVLNVHASLLPKYRGASPIQSALLNGESETGVTVMKISEKLDAGDILTQRKVKIEETDNAQTLHDKLSKAGAELLTETIPLYVSGKIKPTPQNEEEATYCFKITKEMGKIDWKRPAREIFNKVRAFTPWPSAYTFFRGKRVQILKVSLINREGEPGEVLEVKDNLIVGAGEGALKIELLKPEGKREMTGADFVRGYRVKVGDKFGEGS